MHEKQELCVCVLVAVRVPVNVSLHAYICVRVCVRVQTRFCVKVIVVTFEFWKDLDLNLDFGIWISGLSNPR